MTEIHMILGGDVMLGRNIGELILEKGVDYPLGGISNLLRKCDVSIVNLECAITDSKGLWPKEPKAFYFAAPSQAVQCLKDVDVVNLANNHMLDFDYQGLFDTLKILKENHIRFSGAGKNLREAGNPLFFDRKNISFSMVSFCDHQMDFAAGEDTPGINYLDLSDEENAIKCFRQALTETHWPILSLHWGPNMVSNPGENFVRLARSAIDMGYGIVYGHSAHIFQGIELYKGKPIFYSCGDLVDDYYVDPYFNNDHQILFELVLTRSELKKIILHPVFISNGKVAPATGVARKASGKKITQLCQEMGTSVSGNLEINLSAEPKTPF